MFFEKFYFLSLIFDLKYEIINFRWGRKVLYRVPWKRVRSCEKLYIHRSEG